MPKYGIATLLENCPPHYEFAPKNPPLHLTHIDSFVVDLDVAQLNGLLEKALASQRQFKVRALQDEFYGPGKDIPVTVLKLNPELVALHNLIMDTLGSSNAELSRPHFHGTGFSPHVSVYGQRRVAVGNELLIKDLCVASKVSDEEGANHKILFTIPFK